MSNIKYAFTNLNDVMGSVNVIAVVKFSRPPGRTRGSGYSLFASVTDPSLNGSKLPCIFFNDTLEGLPQIQEVGDVIVMHRLKVKEYRGGRHGYGYGTMGFAAAVFPGDPDAPLEPRASQMVCHVSLEDKERVHQLRLWFRSPSCPVLKESVLYDSSCLGTVSTHAMQTQQYNTARSVELSTLWHAQPEQFCIIVGQIVAIYRYPSMERCVLLYLWDGVPRSLDSSNSITNFIGPPKDHFRRLLPDAHMDALLGAITGHGLASVITDWTVPLFLYDEHAVSEVISTLKPGDVIRAQNVHVQRCRAFDCERPGCRRLVIHGGGHQYGRGIQIITPVAEELPQSAPSSNFPDALRKGLSIRPFYLTMVDSRISAVLTILQICHIPLIMHLNDAEQFDMHTPSLCDTNRPVPNIPPGSWVPTTHENSPHRTAIIVRVAGIVTDVYPHTTEDLKNGSIVACERCRSAIRLSSLLGSQDDFCDCCTTGQQRRVNTRYKICPFTLLKLEDATGEILIFASGKQALNLITRNGEHDLRWGSLIADPDQANGSGSTKTQTTLNHFRGLINKPVDLCLQVSWLTEWDLGIPASVRQLDLQFELANNVTFRWT